ncbi:MAG: sigma-70 family RNA polymerase sigma factor, partial [Actinomycetota bacterium]
DDDAVLADFLEDDTAEVPSEAASFVLLREQLAGILHTLSEREREVIRLRFGMDGAPPRTLEEVGAEFGITRERVRQVEAKTLSKLRHPSRARKLRGYLDGI